MRSKEARKTKPESIETQRSLRRDAVKGAVIHSLLQLIAAGFFLWGALALRIPRWLSVVLFLLAVPCVIVIPATLVALNQRLKEIKGGEQDAARQY